jgi:hypothetical protein
MVQSNGSADESTTGALPPLAYPPRDDFVGMCEIQRLVREVIERGGRDTFTWTPDTPANRQANVDAAHHWIDKQKAELTASFQRRRALADTKGEQKYADGTLDGCARDVATERQGWLNRTLYNKAFKLGLYVNVALLDRDDIELKLFDATRAWNFWDVRNDERTCENTIASGLDDAVASGLPPNIPEKDWATMDKQSAGKKAKADGDGDGDETVPSLLDKLGVTGDWLDAQVFAALEYVVPELLPEGMGYLGAPPKKGKSFLVGNIALAVASGGLALGCIRVKQRPVLYLALEDGHRRLQDRFRKMNAGQPLPAALTMVIRATPLEAMAVIAEYMERHRDAKPLVILDTLGKVKRGKQSGEDSYQADYAISSQLKALADSAPGSTVLVVHHTRKAATDDFVESLSGTYGIAGAADYVMVLARPRGGDDAVLSVTGRDVLEAEYALHADDGVVWRLIGKDLAESRGNAEAVAKMIKLLQTHGRLSVDVWHYINDDGGRIMKPEDVAAEFDLEPKAASQILTRLAKDDHVTKLARGEYGPM